MSRRATILLIATSVLLARNTRTRADDKAARAAAQANAVAQQVEGVAANNPPADARKTVDDALASAPGNPSLHFLRGILAYEAKQYPLADEDLQKTLVLFPNDVATLNNLALVHLAMNEQAIAFEYFERAMLADPENERILDNVNNALHALPPDKRSSPPVVQAIATFNKLYPPLKKKMASLGLVPFGASWWPSDQLKKELADQKVDQAKFNALKSQWEALQSQVADDLRWAAHEEQQSTSILDTRNLPHKHELSDEEEALAEQDRARALEVAGQASDLSREGAALKQKLGVDGYFPPTLFGPSSVPLLDPTGKQNPPASAGAIAPPASPPAKQAPVIWGAQGS